MMNFDFTPIVQKKGPQIVKRMLIMSVPLVALAFWFSHIFGMALLQGLVLGIMDTLIMFRGINKALPYVDDPEKGLAVMRRYRWYRLIAISSIIVMLLKQKANVLGAFFGLLLTHIFLIIQLTFIAYRLNKKST